MSYLLEIAEEVAKFSDLFAPLGLKCRFKLLQVANKGSYILSVRQKIKREAGGFCSKKE